MLRREAEFGLSRHHEGDRCCDNSTMIKSSNFIIQSASRRDAHTLRSPRAVPTNGVGEDSVNQAEVARTGRLPAGYDSIKHKPQQ